jgi:hypothetical protein
METKAKPYISQSRLAEEKSKGVTTLHAYVCVGRAESYSSMFILNLIGI